MEIEKIRKELKNKKNEETVIRFAKRISKSCRQEESSDQVLVIAKRLWDEGSDEERFLAIHLVASIDRFLDASHWNFFRDWLKDAGTETLRDGVARRIFGALVMEDRSWLRVLCHWAQSKDPQERRAAVMAVFPRTRQMSDHEAAVSVLESLMGEEDPAVRISVLRLIQECLEINREGTLEFLGKLRDRTSATILDSVLEGISVEEQERIRQF